MAIEVVFDPVKDATNQKKHGVSLALAAEFDIDHAQIDNDVREDYGEDRYTAVGLIGTELYTFVFTMRRSTFRAISLRRANRHEEKSYANHGKHGPRRSR